MRDRLHDAGELLYRQIRKNQIDEGQPGSHAFRPLPKDQNMLSLDRGALTTPREAHALFIENGFESVRVYGISVGELSGESIPSYSDPLLAPPLTKANPYHALADYSAHTTARQKVVSKRLTRLAIARGCLFNADHAGPP
jgi:hypothetical protein